VRTVPAQILLESVLLSEEEGFPLRGRFHPRQELTAEDILGLELPAKARVDALLRYEFLREKQLRSLACDFATHALHIFSSRAPDDRSLRRCLTIARRYVRGNERLDELRAAVRETVPVVWKLEGTPFVSAFEAGLAVTFLDYKDASESARMVAAQAQKAARRMQWESRKSNVQPMTASEREAAWQLGRLVCMLT
jgi:hypothetical protein